MDSKEIRLRQRFSNFEKALKLYEEAIAPKMSRLEEEGLIQRFEYSFELAWKCLQDLLQEQGYFQVRGTEPVIQQAFQDGLIANGPLWMEMLQARNETVHLYDESTFQSVSGRVKVKFLQALQTFRKSFPK